MDVWEYELVCFLPVGRGTGSVQPPRKKSYKKERVWLNSFGGDGKGSGSK